MLFTKEFQGVPGHGGYVWSVEFEREDFCRECNGLVGDARDHATPEQQECKCDGGESK